MEKINITAVTIPNINISQAMNHTKEKEATWVTPGEQIEQTKQTM